MNKKDMDFLNKLKQEVNADMPVLPENLSADSISNLVENEEINKKSRKTAYRIAAAAASLVIVLAASIIGIKNYNPPIKTITPSNIENSGDVYTSEYKEIQEFFKSLRAKARVNAVSEDLISGFNYGVKETEGNFDTNAGTSSAPSATFSDANSTAYGTSFSKTENQVENVLEADIIKNDGRYLYIVHAEDANKIIIVDTKKPKELKISAKITLPEDDKETVYAKELFLKDNRLVVLTGTAERNKDAQIINDTYVSVSCCAHSPETKCGVFIYDISNVSKPQLISEYSVDGSYLTSRLTDGTLLVMSEYSVPLYEDNKKLEDACIPSYFFNGEKFKIPAENIDILKDTESGIYSVILKINLNNKDALPEASAILGFSSNVYCNQSDIYLARHSYDDKNGALRGYTEIFRFSFTDGLEYKANVKVKGTILNQFSMDEYNGFFRIATTDHGEQSYVTVLDKELNIIGQLGGIAKGESIYAVRFIENTAYVVTFYQTDPLFIIDLSNPSSPKITGELKIPGFSNMLFPYSENLLIGIGQDGTESGSNGKIKVSLFDISDKKHPKEISKAVTDSESYTTAQYDHKAYMKFTDTGEFAIPIYDYRKPENESTYLCCFKVENNKITAYKKYETVNDNQNTLHRGAYTGNTVFALCSNELYAFDRDSAEIISTLKFLDKSEYSKMVSESGIIIE